MRLIRRTLIAAASPPRVRSPWPLAGRAASEQHEHRARAAAGYRAAASPTPSRARARRTGGTLNLITAEGWEHLDPGASYFQIDYWSCTPPSRPLYIVHARRTRSRRRRLWPPGRRQISTDGKTVTVHIKSDWNFSPPLNRAVTSKDVAFAFQRDFNANVQNGYARGYYPIVGAKLAKGNGRSRGSARPTRRRSSSI